MLKIGNKEYKFKKDAIAHYRKMLNSYDFGQSLNDADFDDIIDLMNYDYLNYLAEQKTSENVREHNINNETEIDSNFIPSLPLVENNDNIEDDTITLEIKKSQKRLAELYNLSETTFKDITFSGCTTERELFISILQHKTPLDVFKSIGEMYDWKSEQIYAYKSDEIYIKDIKVVKRIPYSTKCFEIFYSDDTSYYISYLMIINNSDYYTPENKFRISCRNSIRNDIRMVKQEYFDENSEKGRVKCQETGKLSKWEELVIDHRQPNTFSVIVDRFKEVYSIELDKIEYTLDDQGYMVFKEDNLTEQFRKYHKEKANLRIVREECNLSRTGLARIKRTSRDLAVKCNIYMNYKMPACNN